MKRKGQKVYFCVSVCSFLAVSESGFWKSFMFSKWKIKTHEFWYYKNENTIEKIDQIPLRDETNIVSLALGVMLKFSNRQDFIWCFRLLHLVNSVWLLNFEKLSCNNKWLYNWFLWIPCVAQVCHVRFPLLSKFYLYFIVSHTLPFSLSHVCPN